MMDSNNFPNKIGVGEREGRLYVPEISKYGFSHGIGRSGDVNAP